MHQLSPIIRSWQSRAQRHRSQCNGPRLLAAEHLRWRGLQVLSLVAPVLPPWPPYCCYLASQFDTLDFDVFALPAFYKGICCLCHCHFTDSRQRYRFHRTAGSSADAASQNTAINPAILPLSLCHGYTINRCNDRFRDRCCRSVIDAHAIDAIDAWVDATGNVWVDATVERRNV